MLRLVRNLAAGAWLLGTAAAGAAQFHAAQEHDRGDAHLGSNLTDDVYAVGPRLELEHRVAGDLVAAAGQIDLRGAVGHDVLVVAGQVDVFAPVGDDLRAAAGEVTVSDHVGGDVVAIVGQMELLPTARVAGDLVLAAGRASVAGAVDGSVRIRGSEVRLDARVAGPVEITSDRLQIGPHAQIAGRLVFTGPNAPEIMPGAAVAALEHRRQTPAGPADGAARVALLIGVQVLALGLAGLILLWLAGPLIERIVHEALQSPFHDLGLGLVAMVGVPLALVLLLASVVGGVLAVVAATAWGFALALTGVLVAVLLGAAGRGLVTKQRRPRIDVFTVGLGVLLTIALSWLPVLGWLALALSYVLMFGALVRVARRQLSPKRRPLGETQLWPNDRSTRATDSPSHLPAPP